MNRSKKKIFIIFTICSILLCSFYFYKGINNSSTLVELNNEKLSDYINKEDDVWVYVGRPSCEECSEFQPKLENVLKDIDQQLYYYDTDHAREEDEQEMIKLIKTLNVKTVPTIVHLKNDTVQDKFIGDHTEKEIRDLLSIRDAEN